MLDRGPAERLTRRRALAGEVELLAHGRRVVRVPGVVVARERISPVEHQGAQALRVPQREDLREIGAVGVPVQVRARDTERLEERGEVIHREIRAVELRARPERAAAGPDVFLRQARRALQGLAVDRTRVPGAAVVHDEDVARGA